MISSDDARQHILAACRPRVAETVAVAAALDRVVAQDVVSGENLPPFDNSAMDGFAIVTGGLELAPGREFAVAGSQAAGDGETRIGSGACEIMTGASLPAGLDAVLPAHAARPGAGTSIVLPLAAPMQKKAGLRYLQKARVVLAEHAQLQLLGGQESFRIQPLLAANAWMVLDEDAGHLPAGTPVEVYGLDGQGVLLRTSEDIDGH